MSKVNPNNIEKIRARTNSFKSRMISASDVVPALDSNYLVKHWLEQGALSLFYGASNTGKTFLALSLAASIATGTDWFGERVNQGAVVYIAAEGGAGIKNRIYALKHEFNELDGSPFYLLSSSLNLLDETDFESLLAATKELKPTLIVIDTLARVMGIGDENSASDAGKVIAACDAIRTQTGAHVMLVHHTGKDAEKGARGSSAFRAAVDSEIEVNARGEIICRKQRDMELGQTKFFELVSIEIGTDKDGDAVTTAKVVQCDGNRRVRSPLKGKAEVAYYALDDALEMHGDSYKEHPHLPSNTKVVELSKWKTECIVRGITDSENPDSQRKAFDRVKSHLIEKDRVRIYDRYVWKVFDDES